MLRTSLRTNNQLLAHRLKRGLVRYKTTVASSLKSDSSIPFSPKSGPDVSNGLQVLSFDHHFIELSINDRKVHYNNVFLRDSCQAAESVDFHSKQKTFTTSSLPLGVMPTAQPVILTDTNGNQLLAVDWSDGQKSLYDAAFLTRYSNPDKRHQGRYFDHKMVFWNKKTLAKNYDSIVNNVHYTDYLHSESALFETLTNLNKYGIAFVNRLPDVSENVVESKFPIIDVAQRIGYIKETFYGRLFDVKSVPNAKNIAFTAEFLPLHMDLLYYESPPGLQILHALRNSAEGGENIFADSFLAAKHIRETDPAAYHALTTLPMNYHYENDEHNYFYSRPLIVEDPEYVDPRTKDSLIKEVNYSPPFQAPFEHGITKNLAKDIGDSYLFKDFLRGLRKFENFINDEENQLEVKLDEGQAVIFDNRRILHSRKAFSLANGGNRWLMGCYLDKDAFQSKLRYMDSKQAMS